MAFQSGQRVESPAILGSKTVKTVSAPKRARVIGPRQVLNAIEGQIKPVRAGPLYQLGLLAVAITMLILPVVYLLVVAALGLGIYEHAVHSAWVLEDVPSRAAVIMYLGPIIMGLIALGFMIKPLIGRRVDDSVPLTLRPEDEPVLFEFVQRLCRMVGAPMPVRIDVDLAVNASASFRGGWMSLFGRDLVLMFGLPLVAGMDTRQFAGVLAHELGHFTQGSGMRLTYIIRRMNFWFARVVYRRDHWDVGLRNAARADHGLVAVIAWITILIVWLTRRVLWALMLIGHGVSAFMLRQMEYNADHCQCRVAGSDDFARTFAEIQCLGLSSTVAFSDLGTAWRERRLCDDLPALIRSRQTSMPEDVRTKLIQEERKQKSGWFDSHPSDRARQAAAQRENATALFKPKAPATILFKDFAELSRIATMLFYRKTMGAAFQTEHLTRTDNLVTARVEQQKTFDVMDVYFRGLLDPCRPVFPERLTIKPPNESAVAQRLLELRTKLLARESQAKAAAQQFREARERAGALAAARELRTAGFRKCGAEDPKFDAMNDEVLKAEESRSRQQEAIARSTLDDVMQIAMERLNLALLVLEQKNVKSTEEPADERRDDYDLVDDPSPGTGDALLTTLTAMRSAGRDIEPLEGHMVALNVLLGRVRPSGGNPKPLLEALIWHSRKASGLLREIHQQLTDITYPYPVDGRRLTLCRYLIESLPPPNAVGQVASSAETLIGAYRSLYMRAMSDLTQRAVQLESELGLPALEASASST
jgi:Zn-dependent protease with chaperone function